MKNNFIDVVKLLKLSTLSSYKIAQETGISDQTIQNYRDDRTKPKGANLIILSKYLDSMREELILKSGPAPKNLIIDERPNEVNESVPIFNCSECARKQKEIDSKQREIDALTIALEAKDELLNKYRHDAKKENGIEDSVQSR